MITYTAPHARRLHRPEIDGLRALAVLPVIMFHAGFDLFSGGYVGVDIFFVISGFLITSIIVDDLRSGDFSIVRFYERRARRILPALFFVMAACLPAVWLLMLPNEAAAFGKSAIAVSGFVSNMLFWRSSGYFDPTAEEKPLLHTWSLGVEEQFYIVFPLLLLLLWRMGLRRLMLLLVALALMSLAASQWALERYAAASFYLTPFRVWELLAGSLLALAGSRMQPEATAGAATSWPREVLGLLALALIAVPIFGYDAHTPFPGLRAVPPVLGTILMLAFVRPHTLVGRLLTLPPMLWVGAISYSAYLWHQPLLAFGRLSQAGTPSPWMMGALALLALALADLSWRYVEAPFRHGSNWSRRAVFTGSAALTLALVAIGATLVVTKGLPQRWNEQTRLFIEPLKSRIEGCPPVDSWLHVCHIGAPGQPGEIVLLGDSHAYALAGALDERLNQAGRGGYMVHTTCHPIAGVFDSREPTTPERLAFCDEANRRLLAFVGQLEVRGVLVAIRWNGRLYPMGDEIDAPAFDNHEGGIERDFPFRRNLARDSSGQLSDAAAPKQLALQRYLASLTALRPTVVLDPVPEVGWNPPRLNLLAMAKGDLPPDLISTSWARYQSRNANVQRLLQYAEGVGVHRTRAQNLLCNVRLPGRCVVQADGILLYTDDDHLSTAGALPVVDDMLARIAPSIPASGFVGGR